MAYEYLTPYEDQKCIKTPRGLLLIQCVCNNIADVEKQGYTYYFALNSNLQVYVKHIDAFHCLFALVDKQAPYKSRFFADKKYYLVAMQDATYEFKTREQMIIMYNQESKNNKDIPLFRDWCKEKGCIEVTDRIKFCVLSEIYDKNHTCLLNTAGVCSIVRTTKHEIVYVHICNKNTSKAVPVDVRKINKAGISVFNLKTSN